MNSSQVSTEVVTSKLDATRAANFATFELMILWLAFALLGRFAFAADMAPVCVTKEGVSLRKGPGGQHAVSWVVPQYMPLMKIDQKGPWLKVQDLEGRSHWVRASSVSSKINCTVVKSKSAKTRQGPGHDNPAADPQSVKRYASFIRVDRDDEWIEVKDAAGNKFWLHETNVWIPMVRMRVTF